MRSKLIISYVFRKSVASKLFTLCLYFGCLIYVFVLGIHCFKKYRSGLQSVDISYDLASGHPFPDLTFCPSKDNQDTVFVPKPYDAKILEACNLTLDSYVYLGPWVGQNPEHEDCSNPKILRQAATVTLEDLNLDNIVVWTFSNENFPLNYSMQDLWEVKPFRENGNCYTLKIPKHIVEMGISIVNIRSRGFQPIFKSQTKLDLFIHDQGLLLNDLPHGSSAGMRLEAPLTVTIPIDHEIIQLLDYDGHTCVPDQNYQLSECRHGFIFNESMKYFNCTTPFGINQDHICTSQDEEFTEKVSGFFYTNLTLNGFNISECPYPCHFQKFRILREFYSEASGGNGINVTLLFDQLVKVTRAYISYTELELLAEFGGYVGLFLGISICHLTFAFDKLLDLIWQTKNVLPSNPHEKIVANKAEQISKSELNSKYCQTLEIKSKPDKF